MKILNTAHLAFKVSNREKSLYFYRDCLGLKEKFTINYSDLIEFSKGRDDLPTLPDSILLHADRPWLTYLEIAPHQLLELFFSDDHLETNSIDDNHVGYLHLSLEVEDIHAAKAELIEKGVAIVTDIGFGPDNTYQLWIADPDGNRIELMEYTDKSLQIIGK
jgi:catechol 2,3-dioxygenase-like lactoylglutathione lyase family enzyme